MVYDVWFLVYGLWFRVEDFRLFQRQKLARILDECGRWWVAGGLRFVFHVTLPLAVVPTFSSFEKVGRQSVGESNALWLDVQGLGLGIRLRFRVWVLGMK